MPDSSSLSAVSNLSSVIPNSLNGSARNGAPVESLLLASDMNGHGNTANSSKIKKRKKKKGQSTQSGHQSRDSTEQLPNGDQLNGGYDMEQLVRYDDSPPKHP